MNRNDTAKAVPLTVACVSLLFGLGSIPAHAIEFSSGELSGSFDTTVTYGVTLRVNDPDEDNVGKTALDPTVGLLPNAGQRAAPGRWSVNSDDGNLNYDGGDLVSNAVKLTSELDVRYRSFGAFARVSAFYDFENEDRDALSRVARNLVGKDFRVLDAFVWGDHLIGERAFTWRLGQQVVSWGESTFIQNGLNVINPVDVSKLRVAGAELKEAFEGVTMIWASFDLTPTLSVEPLYLFEYQQIDPDPAGTFFSTNDIATPGGSYTMLGFGTAPQPVINPDLYQEVCLLDNLAASDSGLPPQLVATGCATSFPRVETIFPDESGQYGVALHYFSDILNNTEFGLYYLNYHSRRPLISGRSITSTDLRSGQYWVEYPEDIQLFGASFNASIGTWSLAGEVSYRPDAPLQIDDVEVVFAGLTPLNPLLPAPINQFKSQLGEFGPGERIQGWEEHEMWQAQSTLTKLFGPNNPLKADQIAFVAELGFNYVSDLPPKNFLRFNGDGTDTGGGPDFLTGDFRNPITEPDGFADDFSWGYRILIRPEYNNAFGTAWTMSPSIGWNHDVSGTTPGPGGAFIDGRKQVTVGVAFSYLQTWGFDLSYTAFFGAGPYNLLKDRDFVSASVRFSF